MPPVGGVALVYRLICCSVWVRQGKSDGFVVDGCSGSGIGIRGLVQRDPNGQLVDLICSAEVFDVGRVDEAKAK